MSKFAAVGVPAFLLAATILAVIGWFGSRFLSPSSARRRPLLIGWVIAAAQLALEAAAWVSDRTVDRLELNGTTREPRRDTLVAVVASAMVFVVLDVAFSRSRGWRYAVAGVALAMGFAVATVVDLDGVTVDRVAFAILLCASTHGIHSSETIRPGAGLALGVVAAVFAAILTTRSPDLTGLAVTMGAATAVAASAVTRIGRQGRGVVGWSGSAAVGAALAIATATTGGGDALVPAAAVALIVAVVATVIAGRRGAGHPTLRRAAVT